jgi:hypothetical protein
LEAFCEKLEHISAPVFLLSERVESPEKLFDFRADFVEMRQNWAATACNNK